MIKSIYIMKQNGLLVYSKKYKKYKEDEFDDNILIAFFASISNFSREALQNAIQYIDLGQDNKLVLFEHQEEKLLATAIVNSSDDNDLIISVLRDILQDFINEYSPDYEPDKININIANKIIDDNVKIKTSLSILYRWIFSWVVLIPIAILIILLNIWATNYYFQYNYLEDKVFTHEELINNFIPEVVFIASIIILVAFVVPNLISGYIVLNRNLAFLNSALFIVIILLAYLFSVGVLLFYIILFYLPTAVFVSVVCAYVGYRLGIKYKIVKK